MTLTRFAAGVLLAAVLPVHAVDAATTAPTIINYGPGKAAAVPQNPVDPKETPEGIHQDAARDPREDRGRCAIIAPLLRCGKPSYGSADTSSQSVAATLKQKRCVFDAVSRRLGQPETLDHDENFEEIVDTARRRLRVGQRWRLLDAQGRGAKRFIDPFAPPVRGLGRGLFHGRIA